MRMLDVTTGNVSYDGRIVALFDSKFVKLHTLDGTPSFKHGNRGRVNRDNAPDGVIVLVGFERCNFPLRGVLLDDVNERAAI